MLMTNPAVPFPADAVERTESLVAWEEACAIWPTLSPLKAVYPGFGAWYWGKVVPGLLKGSRCMLRQGPLHAPSGIVIAKRDVGENKICTLWVSDETRGRGTGRLLLEEAIGWIGDEHPLFTVPAERYQEFQPLMERFRFEETGRMHSIYRDGVVEHIYNGKLSVQPHL